MHSSFSKSIFIFLLFVLFIPLEYHAQNETLKLYKKNNKKQWLKAFSESTSGLHYKIEEQGQGKSPMAGDLVAVHYVGFFENDTIFDSSYKRGEPLKFNFGVGQVIKGWDEGLGFLKEGGKAILQVPPHLGYGNRQVGNIRPGSTLFFQVELIKVESSTSVKPFNTAGIDTVHLASGLKYLVVEPGEGAFVDENQWAYLHFVGYLPSGKIFDASALRGEPVRYSIGSDKLPKAFNEIVGLMKPGGKFHVISPAQFAYGDEGLDGIVPPRSTVKFDIDLLYTTPKFTPKPFEVEGKDTIVTKSGLKYIMVEEGQGRIPVDNDVVKIHFSGYFENGKMFQSSLTNDDDIIFAVGQNHVIAGIDEVVKHMPVGSKVRALVPWELGYGEEGNFPDVPPRANLIFDIELIVIAE